MKGTLKVTSWMMKFQLRILVQIFSTSMQSYQNLQALEEATQILLEHPLLEKCWMPTCSWLVGTEFVVFYNETAVQLLPSALAVKKIIHILILNKILSTTSQLSLV